MKSSTAGLYLLLLFLVLLAFSFSSTDGKHRLSDRSAALSEKARAKVLGEDGGQPPLDEKNMAEMKEQVEELLSSVDETINKCVTLKTPLEELAGEWKLSYYREKGKREEVAIHLQYTELNGGKVHMLLGSLKESGNPKDYIIQLMQLVEVGQPAILFSLLPVGEHIIKLPVLLVDAQPALYFTVFQTGLLLPQYIDWAIYTRPGVRLSPGQLKKATAGLRCLTSDAEVGEGELQLVFPVGKKKRIPI